MPFSLHVAQHLQYPGAINIVIQGTPNTTAALSRVDPAAASAQPVRNFTGIGASGEEFCTDMDAPLGRPVHYNLTSATGVILATSREVTCRPLKSGKGLLRSVLSPSSYVEVEPQDEKGVSWVTTSKVHYIVGSSTPVTVGEVLQRHKGTMVYLCRSIPEADALVALCRPGTPLLLRHSPCAQPLSRDVLFFVTEEVSEARYQYDGWRLVAVPYQSTAFVHGDTDMPDFDAGWNFQALSESAPDFGTLASLWRDFHLQTVLPMPSWVPRTAPEPDRAVVVDAWA